MRIYFILLLSETVLNVLNCLECLKGFPIYPSAIISPNRAQNSPMAP